MIPILVTLAALAVFGPPNLKHKEKPACKPDSVFVVKSYYWHNGFRLVATDTLKELSPHRSPTR